MLHCKKKDSTTTKTDVDTTNTLLKRGVKWSFYSPQCQTIGLILKKKHTILI